ncbi:hypothetical protein AURDEDRAFT_145254 [Auricularia subglabra TFB-10046 SS5]|nr:hypothetical protein AURDEDRAFT_145254 [Auricularia subglabra TFB-10046 SS5]
MLLWRTFDAALLRAQLEDPPHSKLLSILNGEEIAGTDDPIEVEALVSKRSFAQKYAILLDERPSGSVSPGSEVDNGCIRVIRRLALGQLYRRFLLYTPHTRGKVLRLGSFKDLFLSLDVTSEDLRACELAMKRKDTFGNGLVWWKCAVQEALEIASGSEAKGPTFEVLGGMIYVDPSEVTLPANGWVILTAILGNPASLESMFTPLCSTFEEMHTFFSFMHLSLPPPDYVTDLTMAQSRAVLCQAGFLMAELMGMEGHLKTVATDRPGKSSPGETIEWRQNQRRAFVYGIIASSEDAWAAGFIAALASSEHCIVVVYDETKGADDPDALLILGGPRHQVIADWYLRSRTFDAPQVKGVLNKNPCLSDFVHSIDGLNPGPWETLITASEMLVFDPPRKQKQPSFAATNGAPGLGWVTRIKNGEQGNLFSNKQFPTRCVCIFDAEPDTDGLDLLRRVKVAALKAAGILTQGTPTDGDIAVAAFELHERRVLECFSPLPHT